jgi:hypothetical protein
MPRLGLGTGLNLPSLLQSLGFNYFKYLRDEETNKVLIPLLKPEELP